MSESKKPALRSEAKKSKLRSYGSLSHGGMPSGDEATVLPKRSKGIREHTGVNESTPTALEMTSGVRKPVRKKDQ